MTMFKHFDTAVTEIPLSPFPSHRRYEALNDVASAEISQRKSRLSWKDISVLAIQIICFTAAFIAVYQPRAASYIGQLHQLILIGLLLAVMASFMEDQVIRTMLVYLGYRRNSALQDFDAVLRKDVLAPKIRILVRSSLFLIAVLPLGLAVSYKLFSGGSSHTRIEQGDGIFGYSAAPGQQRIGDGLTLIAEIYQPFWSSPVPGRTYGYNLYIADNDTSVIPDTPYPEYLTSLQSQLNSGEYITMTTEVNATVSRLANPTPDERASDDWWQDVADYFGGVWTENGGDINGANNGFWAGANMGTSFRSNFSVAFLSAWNTTRNETFFSEAYRCEHYRELYTATWKISPSSIKLISMDAPHDSLSAAITPNQSIIQNDWLSIQELYSNFLGEYDWHNRAGAFNFPYPSSDSNNTAATMDPSSLKWTLEVNTVCPLSAAMLWARITSLNGGDRPIRDPDRVQHTMYTKPSAEISLTMTKLTLKRSPLLLLVLVANPTIVLLCIIVKMRLYHSPIDDNFNAVSLLASTIDSDMSVLKGASLSGKLDKRIQVAFSTVSVTDEERSVKCVKAVLDQPKMSARFSRDMAYA